MHYSLGEHVTNPIQFGLMTRNISLTVLSALVIMARVVNTLSVGKVKVLKMMFGFLNANWRTVKHWTTGWQKIQKTFFLNSSLTLHFSHVTFFVTGSFFPTRFFDAPGSSPFSLYFFGLSLLTFPLSSCFRGWEGVILVHDYHQYSLYKNRNHR